MKDTLTVEWRKNILFGKRTRIKYCLVNPNGKNAV